MSHFRLYSISNYLTTSDFSQFKIFHEWTSSLHGYTKHSELRVIRPSISRIIAYLKCSLRNGFANSLSVLILWTSVKSNFRIPRIFFLIPKGWNYAEFSVIWTMTGLTYGWIVVIQKPVTDKLHSERWKRWNGQMKGQVRSGQVWDIRRSSASPRPPCDGTLRSPSGHA